MSIKAYQNAQDKVTDPRRLEIMTFQKCNALLTAAERDRTLPEVAGEPLAAAKSAAHALYESDRLWTTLLADLASDDNRLDPALRAGLISLGLWACRYADRVRGDRTASFAPLIDLNAQLIAGLSASLAHSHGPAPAMVGAAAETMEPVVT